MLPLMFRQLKLDNGHGLDSDCAPALFVGAKDYKTRYFLSTIRMNGWGYDAHVRYNSFILEFK